VKIVIQGSENKNLKYKKKLRKSDCRRRKIMTLFLRIVLYELFYMEVKLALLDIRFAVFIYNFYMCLFQYIYALKLKIIGDD